MENRHLCVTVRPTRSLWILTSRGARSRPCGAPLNQKFPSPLLGNHLRLTELNGREVLVRDLQKQREEREARRRRETAVQTLQAIWKGRQARFVLTEKRLKEWLLSFAPYVADSQKGLSYEEMQCSQCPAKLL